MVKVILTRGFASSQCLTGRIFTTPLLSVYKLVLILLGILAILVIPVSAAITTNGVTVNATCVVFSGTNSGSAEQVYFDYGHGSNGCTIDPTGNITICTDASFSSSTKNVSATGTFTVKRCDEPVFLPGETYKVRACGKTSGCGSTEMFTMYAIVPHETSNFSDTGEAFISNGGDISWVAQHIWDVYTLVWGSFFFLLLIAFVFMNITIKQKSVTISLLLILISGSVLFAIAPPETVQIAEILIALAITGLAIWFMKRR